MDEQPRRTSLECRVARQRRHGVHYGLGNAGRLPTVGLVPTHDGQSDLAKASSIRFELEGSGLPTGLKLATDDALRGTPRERETFSVTVRATDESWTYDMKTFEFTIAEARSRSVSAW